MTGEAVGQWFGVEIRQPIRHRWWRRAGVYVVVDEATGLGYVGATQNLFERARHHLESIARGNFDNALFQSLIEADSTRTFRVLVIAESTSDAAFFRRDEVAEWRVIERERQRCVSAHYLAGNRPPDLRRLLAN